MEDAARQDRPAVSGAPARREVPLHPNESDRLESLRSYGLLDTPREQAYDDLVQLASALLDTPMAAVSLVDRDRQWFKASVGMDINETPRDEAFCAYVAASGEPLVVPDALADPRFRDFELVKGGLRSYAGVPLVGRDGLPLGALCVADTRPRRFGSRALKVQQVLADQVAARMELSRADLRAGLRSHDSVSVDMGAELRQALDRGEIRPFFQPVIDVRTGRASGMEALLRWVHPERGVIGPCDFLPAVEASGMIAPVGRHSAQQALRALRRCYDLGQAEPPFGVSINVSPVQLAEPGFAAAVLEEIHALDLPPEVVTVELTETGVATSVAAIHQELEDLRAGGVKVDIDDFGSGYSTLQRMLDLPLTGLKIDMGIIGRLPDDDRTARVVGWLIRAAHDIGLDVIAEGVETEAQLTFLRAHGCDRVQGHLFGRALPIESFFPAPLDRAG
ncbi:sensor domain-containing phosphodiesterase [Nocardioides pelophilus]|uniref:sensor domain-containing phosphodiesterase n=1 Tax=Nocardioides pelophilus TaxID=2172019 RepID=UPI00160351C9|nr:EAL domain-containing protein [Nocardioides pelophilus]